jgi:hypothetical protein
MARSGVAENAAPPAKPPFETPEISIAGMAAAKKVQVKSMRRF